MVVDAKLDRRSQRTRKRLRESLVSLTLAGEYETLTIRDITKQAEVGYNTFFRHYSDKDDLLTDVLTDLLAEMEPLFLPPGSKDAPLLNATQIFTHVAKHADLTRVLLLTGTEKLEARVRQMILDGELLMFHQLFYGGDVVHQRQRQLIEMTVHHLVNAMLGLVRWWLQSGMEFTPEEMGRHSMELIGEPLRWMLMRVLQKEDDLSKA